jgi:DNA-binding MarR family transcriptional regulator
MTSAFQPESSGRDVRLDDMICLAIYAAGHAVNRVYKPLLDPLGLTYPQYLVMVALWEQDGRTVGGLGEKLSLESNTLTPLLKRMEAEGLVSRARDPADERQVRVRITTKGEALRARARHIPECLVRASGMGLDEIARLRDDIARLRASLVEAG